MCRAMRSTQYGGAMMTEKEKMQKQTLYDMDYTPRTLNEMIGVLFRK